MTNPTSRAPIPCKRRAYTARAVTDHRTTIVRTYRKYFDDGDPVDERSRRPTNAELIGRAAMRMTRVRTVKSEGCCILRRVFAARVQALALRGVRT